MSMLLCLKTYLVSTGVNEGQVEATGYGGEQPIATGPKIKEQRSNYIIK
jgi:outer membrane protein OmpA-like peptidoglycan-associated protein